MSKRKNHNKSVVELRAAFERLKNDAAINVDRGSPVTLANVAKEASQFA